MGGLKSKGIGDDSEHRRVAPSEFLAPALCQCAFQTHSRAVLTRQTAMHGATASFVWVFTVVVVRDFGLQVLTSVLCMPALKSCIPPRLRYCFKTICLLTWDGVPYAQYSQGKNALSEQYASWKCLYLQAKKHSIVSSVKTRNDLELCKFSFTVLVYTQHQTQPLLYQGAWRAPDASKTAETIASVLISTEHKLC